MRFPKEDFEIDLDSETCICPAGHTTRKLYRMGTRTDRTGRTHQLRAFWFDAAVVERARCKSGVWDQQGAIERRVSGAQRSAPLGGWNPTVLLPPVRPDAGKSAQPKAADVDARLAVEHEVADDLARGG